MSITHAFTKPNFQKHLLVKGKNQDSRFSIWRLSRWSPDNAQTTSEDPSGARSSLTWSWREKDCVEMAAFHQLNLYNTQVRQDQGLQYALHPSNFICVKSVNQSGLDQGKDSAGVYILPQNRVFYKSLFGGIEFFYKQQWRNLNVGCRLLRVF